MIKKVRWNMDKYFKRTQGIRFAQLDDHGHMAAYMG